MITHYIVLVIGFFSISSPGDRPFVAADVPEIAMAAVRRRLEKNTFSTFRNIVVKNSNQMPGYIACGEVAITERPNRPVKYEKFFVVVPGSFAVLERDGPIFIRYWLANGC
jgi:hypothetical protein